MYKLMLLAISSNVTNKINFLFRFSRTVIHFDTKPAEGGIPDRLSNTKKGTHFLVLLNLFLSKASIFMFLMSLIIRATETQ